MYYIDPEKLMSFTPVSNSFIDRYFGAIDPNYIAVYIYIERQSLRGKLPKVSELSERFTLNSETVEEIIAYWDSQGMFDKPQAPTYTPTEIAKIEASNSEVSALVQTAGAILGKALGQKEQSTILSLYDYYNLPVEVITILLGHCAEAGKTSISYIEKIAKDWAEKGIKTSEEAEAYLKLYYGDFSKVLKAFGITGRLANAKEKKYIEKWLLENKQPLNLVIEACEQSVINTGKVSWKYADATLKNWLDNNITTIEQAHKFTEENKPKRKQATKSEKSSAPVKKTNKFNNFEERDYNPADLENLALELLKENEDES
ncbi:MAG: DnaD domain protein [Clostridiales bacterium]|nr:DnaD domain protein [Clostridiales bacterium]